MSKDGWYIRDLNNYLGSSDDTKNYYFLKYKDVRDTASGERKGIRIDGYEIETKNTKKGINAVVKLESGGDQLTIVQGDHMNTVEAKITRREVFRDVFKYTET